MHPDISIVLPVHNEEKNIAVLLMKIETVFNRTVLKPYEIIVVDDASDDTSVAAMEEYKNRQKHSSNQNRSSFLNNLSVLVQPVSSGQSKALMRGMAAAQGALIVTMDSDLQHDPADIPKLLEKMDSYDMVCGIRKGRSDGIARLLCSKIANAFRNWITGDSITDSGCTFRIFRKECVSAFITVDGLLCGCELFFYPVLARRRGFRIGEVSVNHRQRTAGNSNYKLMRGRLVCGIKACFKVRNIIKII
jgi:dolichol-phosphate mannosyltransferase